MSHTCLLAGASGLVGREVLKTLLADRDTLRVHAVVRQRLRGVAGSGERLRDSGGAADKLREWPVASFAALPETVPPADEAFCALGTTIAQAGSQEAFRAVDFDAVLAFGRAAREAGVRHFGLVSALGADDRSRVFYNRVKGEVEEALVELGFARLVIARPSLLLGDRAALGQRLRPLERLGAALTGPLAAVIPATWRPIRAEVVARALVHALRQDKPGVRVIESAQLQTLGR